MFGPLWPHDEDEPDDETGNAFPDEPSSSGDGNTEESASRGERPRFGKRIFAVIGIAVGFVVIIGGILSMMNGNKKAANGIRMGVLILIVSFGWFKGTSSRW